MDSSVLAEVFSGLGMGDRVVIGSWQNDEKPMFPYIEYHRDTPNDLRADNRNYFKSNEWLVAVYGKQKDAHDFWELVDKLTVSLDARCVDYSRSGDLFFDDVIMENFYVSL